MMMMMIILMTTGLDTVASDGSYRQLSRIL
jgi:hypothetical protein